MTTSGETPDDAWSRVHDPGLLAQCSARAKVTGFRQDETAEVDDGTAAVGRVDDMHPVETRVKVSPTLRPGDVVLEVDEEGMDYGDSGPQNEHTGDAEPVPCPRRSTAGWGTNWLLIFTSLLASYSMYNYDNDVPDEELIAVDWFLKWAMGRFWKPSTGYLVVVVAVFISSTWAVICRQDCTWLTSFAFSSAFAQLTMAVVWRGGWRETLLQDVPLRLTLAPFMMQIITPIEAWTGWDVTLERRIRKFREAAARNKKDEDEDKDREAHEMGEGRGDGILLDEGGRREGYGAC